MIDGFHFLRPYWLLLVPLTAMLLWWIIRYQRTTSTWQSQCDRQLLAAQLREGGGRWHWLPGAILGIAWLLAILALAGPSWQQRHVPVYNQLESRLILFDLSRSMDSNDLAPGRLVHARYKLKDLVRGAGARQQALVVFAGDGFVVSPFTDDHETLLNLVPGLTTDTVPVQGSRTDKALDIAGEMIQNAGVKNVQIVLITDGIDPRSNQPARALADAGHNLNIIGVGTAEGAPVVLGGGDLLKDNDGNIVVPGVDHQALVALANLGNGRYFSLAADGSDVQWLNRPASITRPVIANVENKVEGTSGTLQWLDNGAWLLLPLILLAGYGFRRGILLLLVIGVLPSGQTAMAFDWNDLWQRPNQQAYQALENGQPGAVPEQSSPLWRGAGAYRQQDYQRAGQIFDEDESANAAFNRGNALAHNGQLEAAVDAWQQALQRDPELNDARHNRDIIQSLLEQKPPSQSGDQGEESSDNPEAGDDQPSGQGGRSSSGKHNGQNTEDLDRNNSDKNQTNREETKKKGDVGGKSMENPSPDSSAPDSGSQNPVAESGPMSEDQQFLQQWLNQVPDDPGGLLRRKFRYQYSQRRTRPVEPEQW